MNTVKEENTTVVPTLKLEEGFLKSKLRSKRYLEISQVFER